MPLQMPSDWVQLTSKVPRPVAAHIVRRVEERQITPEHVKLILAWINKRPLVPPANWYKRFPEGVVLVGFGELPKSILEKGMKPYGQIVGSTLLLPRLAATAPEVPSTPTPPPPSTGIDSPSFKAWFRNSKVVDAEGNPQVVYHGTDKKFTVFSPNKSIMGILWFTSDRTSIEAGEVGANGKGHVMGLYASIQNPARWPEYERLGIGELKARGYDGAILDDPDGTFTGFVFNSNQLKSASRNRGEYRQDKPSILASILPGKQAKRLSSLFS